VCRKIDGHWGLCTEPRDPVPGWYRVPRWGYMLVLEMAKCEMWFCMAPEIPGEPGSVRLTLTWRWGLILSEPVWRYQVPGEWLAVLDG